MSTTKKAAARKPEPEPKAKPSPERDAEIDDGLRAWAAADRSITHLTEALAGELQPRDRLRLQGDLAEAHATQAAARARIAGTA